MMTLSGETVPDIILHSLPKSSLETNMNVDVGFGDSLLDAAPSSHTLSVEGRSPDEGESSTSNILKLSVGCEDSEDDLDYGDNGNLNAQLRSWRMQTGPSSSQFENDFDMELPSEQIKAMITGEEYMFPQTGQRDFAEEVFMVKEPKIVHGYLFGELIGEGSYSKVKEVIEEDSLVRRAIKIIKHNRVRKIPNGVENVQREIKILRKLKHKHVINLIETFRNEEKGKLYIVLEFCLGSLQRHIDSAPGGRLHEYEAHMYFVQLTEGLEYIHSKGIVHKDIKPGNLLLGPDLTLKISDFGVAEELPMFQPDDTCIIVQGTPKFQAPELVSGNTRTFKGFKSDIWSCGVTLFNMISGLYPFEGDAIMKLFENIAHEPLLMPSNVPVTDDLKVFLHGILDKNPLLRWNNDQIKHSTWFNRLFDQKEIDEFLSFKRTIHRPLTVSQGLEALFSDNASLKRGLSIPEVIMEEEIQVHIIPIHKDDPNIIHREIPIHIEPPPPPSRSSRRVFGCFAPSRSP